MQHGGVPVGEYPAVLGHEGAGVVRRVGSGLKDSSLAEGDQVFLSFTPCNKCAHCIDDRKGFCSRFTEINFGGARGTAATTSPITSVTGQPIRGQFFGQSSMSKLAIVSEESIVKVPASAGLTDADLAPLAPLGCGYMTGAGTVLNILKPKASTRVAILGMGAVGLAALMAARSEGVDNVVAVDIFDAKLELAKSVGASHTLNTKTVSDLAEGLREMFPDGVDQIIDTTGVVPLLQSSIKALGHGGTLVILGVAQGPTELTINPREFMVNCKRLIGCIEGASNPAQVGFPKLEVSIDIANTHCLLHQLLPHLITLYKQGKFPVDKLAKVYSADALDTALDDLHSGRIIKPILDWTKL